MVMGLKGWGPRGGRRGLLFFGGLMAGRGIGLWRGGRWGGRGGRLRGVWVGYALLFGGLKGWFWRKCERRQLVLGYVSLRVWSTVDSLRCYCSCKTHTLAAHQKDQCALCLFSADCLHPYLPYHYADNYNQYKVNPSVRRRQTSD